MAGLRDPSNPRRRLSTGLTTRRRVFNVVVTVLSVPLFLLMVLLAIVSTAEGDTEFAVLLIPAAGGFAGALIGVWVSEFRRAYWIEGTCLVRRRFGADQRRDLAAATVAADSVPQMFGFGPSIPRLTATEPGSRPMTLRLRVRERGNRMLPSAELTLLADAISSRPQMKPETKIVVDALRDMAQDPFGTHH